MWAEPPSWLSENGHACLLRFRVRQHLEKYGAQPSQIKLLARFDLGKFDVLYHAYMVEISLHKSITKPLNTLSDFANGNGLVPFYMRHNGWTAPVSWQATFIALAVQAGLLLYVQDTFERKIDIRRLRGRPLLHYSVLPMPESLCKRDTDPFIKSPKMMLLLAQLGANVHCKFEGFTAFTFAFRAFMRDRFSADQSRMLGTLLKLGSNAEEPVLWGLQDRNFRAGDELGRWITSATEDTVTALQLAVRMDNLDVARVLLLFDAKIDALTDADWQFLRKGYIYG